MNKEFKIYTKTGDKGETSLIGGGRVPKYHERIEAYGTLDELNSFIGLIRDQDIDEQTRKTLIEIQDRIFTAESILANDNPKNRTLPEIVEKDVEMLEKEIDKMNITLSPITSFVLPGGHPIISYCHIGRTICRRAERVTLRLAQQSDVNELVIKYLNRLSDYLFVLSRKLTRDLNAIETHWKARI